jgi:exodeoxyribonuclease VII large subunit
MELSKTATDPLNPQAPPAALTVAEVVGRIRQLIERQFPAPLWVEGELSNCSYPASGHIYFSLVDAKATDRLGQRLLLPCAFFRGMNQGLKFKVADGLKVFVLGQVTTYEGKGQYQLKVMRVIPQGKGELQLAFEQMKQRLQAEGLFDEKRKRAIPRMPERVAVITSPAGSAVHDMVSKLRDWFHVIVVPVKVQGEGAAQEIAEAIALVNRLALADVLIVGRGGGSIEDLWAFNEERTARAIVASRIPVISAVGHEDDWTIADFAADLRASTPTDAVKRLVYEQEVFADSVREQVQLLVDSMESYLDDQAAQIDGLGSQLRLLHPMNHLERCLARAQELNTQLVSSTRYALDGASRHLQGLAGRLEALSPLAVLARGYSITFRQPGRHVVTSADDLRAGDELETRLHRGTIFSTVNRTAAAAPAQDTE